MADESEVMKEFEQAAEMVKTLKSKPKDAEMLELYGLFKQAKEGDCNTARPGMLDFTGKAKWDAWDSRKGMTKMAAAGEYVKVANRLRDQYGLQDD